MSKSLNDNNPQGSGRSLSDMQGADEEVSFSFFRRAAKESRERNPIGNELWTPIWELRRCFVGPFYGRFHLDNNVSTTALFVTDTYGVIAHRVNVGWIKGKRRSFPNRENVRCKAWTLDKEGRWISTGKNCPLCIFLGRDPRLVILWALLDGREEQVKIKEQTVTRRWNLKYMAVGNDNIRGNIWDGAGIGARRLGVEPTTKFAQFKVSRGPDEKSSGYGDSWTFMDFIDGAGVTEIDQALATLKPWDELWPMFSAKDMIEIAKTHKKVCDEHNLKDEYDPQAVVKVFGPEGAQSLSQGPQGQQEGPRSLDNAPSAGRPATGPGGPSLNDLAARSDQGEPQPQGTGIQTPGSPSLDQLKNLDGSGPAQPEKQPQGKKAEDDDDDDWNPWEDKSL